jgi:hypothetical protein
MQGRKADLGTYYPTNSLRLVPALSDHANPRHIPTFSGTMWTNFIDTTNSGKPLVRLS